MKKMRLSALFSVVIVLTVFAAAWAADTQKQLQALENAYQAGILTDDEYQQKRAALMNRATTGAAPTAPSPLEKSSGTVYRHPSGVAFWYPAGWRFNPLEGIVQLVPPGTTLTGTDYESYFITAENAAGASTASDPQVLAYLDQQMMMLGQELGVYFQRAGGGAAIDTGHGPGASVRLDYTAQAQGGGVKASAYAVLINGKGMIMAGVGVGDRLAGRQKEVTRILRSFGVGQGKLDSRLVGAWQFYSENYIRNDSPFESDNTRATATSVSTTTLQFNADGTWQRDDQYDMIASGSGIFVSDSSHDVSRGQWNADGQHLFMLWEDESFADYQYRIDGGQLKTVKGNRGQTWRRK